MTVALLFDLDGTLLDTDPIHAAAFAEIFAERGREIDREFYTRHLHGRLNADIFAEHFPDEDALALAEEKEARARARLDGVPAMAGLIALLDRAGRNGWPVAVVTNAPRENARAMLSVIGLESRFDAVVIGDECPRGKPHPDPYLAGLSAIGADPARALAFEDSVSGIAAAASAGLAVIGVRTSLSHADLCAAGATDTIVDFDDPALAPHIARLEGMTP